ncbi:hypothetical protein K438DRAFT_1787601 [Mycena galopus ATCC 62051]|nr:hypothetical protein K438DRAFT_1787601 [Mycena galopus ATCC 62051]
MPVPKLSTAAETMKCDLPPSCFDTTTAYSIFTTHAWRGRPRCAIFTSQPGTSAACQDMKVNGATANSQWVRKLFTHAERAAPRAFQNQNEAKCQKACSIEHVHYWQQWRLNNIASRDRECASRNLVRLEWRTHRGPLALPDSSTPHHVAESESDNVGVQPGCFLRYKSETESRNDGEHRAVPPPAPPRNPTTTTSQTHPMRITRPTVQPYCNRTAHTEIPDKKRSPLPDRPITVLSTRQTGETLLQETLKMIKQTEDAGEKRGVGTWVDLLGGAWRSFSTPLFGFGYSAFHFNLALFCARRYSVFARRVRPFALPWLEPASQTSANGCVRDRGCGRGRGRHRWRCGLWGAPTWGVRVRLGRVGNASSWGARVWIAMGREAEMVVHLPESRVQRGGEMDVCAMDGGWGASLVSMGRTRGLTLGSGGSRWGRGAQQAELSLRDTGGGGGVTEKDCAPVTERGRHIGSSESSASGRWERRTTKTLTLTFFCFASTLQADALVKAGVMKRVVALLTSGTSAAGANASARAVPKIWTCAAFFFHSGARRGQSVRACKTLTVCVRRSARHGESTWCGRGGGVIRSFPGGILFSLGGGIIHIGICCASGAARREGSLVKGDGHIAVMCMLRRRIYPLYVSSSYGANVPSLQRKIP